MNFDYFCQFLDLVFRCVSISMCFGQAKCPREFVDAVTVGFENRLASNKAVPVAAHARVGALTLHARTCSLMVLPRCLCLVKTWLTDTTIYYNIYYRYTYAYIRIYVYIHTYSRKFLNKCDTLKQDSYPRSKLIGQGTEDFERFVLPSHSYHYTSKFNIVQPYLNLTTASRSCASDRRPAAEGWSLANWSTDEMHQAISSHIEPSTQKSCLPLGFFLISLSVVRFTGRCWAIQAICAF